MATLFAEFLLILKRHLISLLMISSWHHNDIRGLANSWLSSFLKNRTQYAYLDSHCSITRQVTCGVLQGSTLGLCYSLCTIMTYWVPF